ncbi:hypothetical protein A176_007589 [Myxococcus hansupus]|uniref:Uncharacterized protein n=1 Tax=Pseudomyxococcus hansupus TaxID=1297742 RepID=A0A0H4XQN0_9BACT|nr:hypothetical protein A176_007589 [Myxococcus hansupus]
MAAPHGEGTRVGRVSLRWRRGASGLSEPSRWRWVAPHEALRSVLKLCVKINLAD